MTYTYIRFANDVINLLDGGAVSDELKALMKSKAGDLLKTQTKKAEYSASKAGTKEKELGNTTKEIIAAIGPFLTAELQTAAQLNEQAGTNFPAVNISTAMKHIPNAETGKVYQKVISTKTGKELKPREYAGYRIAG